MSKPLVNSNISLSSNEDEIIENLVFRIQELIKEINHLSEISNEALQNNQLWRNKYEKLKELYLKNINDELTLEDLIAGKINFDEVKGLPVNKTPKNQTIHDKKLNELFILNKDLESKLVKSNEELSILNAQYNKQEINEGIVNENEIFAQKNMEKKYQIKIAEIGGEIKKINESNKDYSNSEQNYEQLTTDYNRLKDEKKKMEVFYQKKIKDLENLKKPKIPLNKPDEQKMLEEVNIQSYTNLSQNKSPKNQAPNEIPVSNIAQNNINEISKPKPKAFHELETIKEIYTSEKIDDGGKEESRDFSEKKPPTILEVTEEQLQQQKKTVEKPKKQLNFTNNKPQPVVSKDNMNRMIKKETKKTIKK